MASERRAADAAMSVRLAPMQDLTREAGLCHSLGGREIGERAQADQFRAGCGLLFGGCDRDVGLEWLGRRNARRIDVEEAVGLGFGPANPELVAFE
jgi:hypothetical protein